jgi:hypothetical protein
MQLIRTRASSAKVSRCTGPRSPEGKKRVAQNALRHGLARTIASDEPWSEPMRLLIDAIVGGDRHEERLHLAHAIAEPAMEVMRVRRARQSLLDVALRTQRFGPDPLNVLGPRKFVMFAGKKLPQGGSIESDPELNPFALGEQEDREAAIAEVVLKLSALDRYERRALSRRKFAIRDWDDYEARQKRTTPISPRSGVTTRSPIRDDVGSDGGEAAGR